MTQNRENRAFSKNHKENIYKILGIKEKKIKIDRCRINKC